MMTRTALALGGLLGIASLGTLAGCSQGGQVGPAADAAVDGDYILALTAANEFLDAWRMRDQVKGVALLTPELLAAEGREAWGATISGCSNPHHESYEITGGRRLADGRFAFDIQLYLYYTNFPDVYNSPRVPPGTMVLKKVAHEEWRVDGLSMHGQTRVP